MCKSVWAAAQQNKKSRHQMCTACLKPSLTNVHMPWLFWEIQHSFLLCHMSNGYIFVLCISSFNHLWVSVIPDVIFIQRERERQRERDIEREKEREKDIFLPVFPLHESNPEANTFSMSSTVSMCCPTSGNPNLQMKCAIPNLIFFGSLLICCDY